MQTPLHYACRDGDIELVKDYVEGRNGHALVELNAVDNCGRAPLHIAAKWGKLEVAKYLVEKGANVNLKDQRKRTPIELASEEATIKVLERMSLKKRDQLTDHFASRRAYARTMESDRAAGGLTEVEFDHQMQRLELDNEWEDTKKIRDIRVDEVGEAAEQASMQLMLDFMETRPAELKQEAYDRSMSDLKKKNAKEKKDRIEFERLEKIRLAEEKRANDKAREERRIKKELQAERICQKCGTTYTKESNRDGQCSHVGKWSPWGLDKQGKKCEWEFFWTCCQSQAYDGPLNGMSICARSDAHEESEADIMKRQAKMLKKISIEQAKKR